MIPKRELDKAIEIAKKYHIEQLYLIGSALYKNPEETNDYDFAVRGVPQGAFFRFYGELFQVMSKNVDLINISGEKTKFNEIVLRDGKLIYDKTTS